MLRATVLGIVLPLALAGCGPDSSSTDAHAAAATVPEPAALVAPTKQASAVPVATATSVPSVQRATDAATQAEDLGSFTDGDATLVLHDAMVLRNNSEEITILLTPTTLSDKERASIRKKPDFYFPIFADKSAPGYPDRYPYAEVTLHLSGPASPENVKSYYIKASGVKKANFTNNLNGQPNKDARVELLKVDGEHVRMKFSGSWEILEDHTSWAFDIDV